MTLSVTDIKSLDAIDLTPFEIRGAKSGVNNARTTGPVYVDGTYIPFNNVVYGTGDMTSGDSTIYNFSFRVPYTTVMNATNLRVGDTLSADSTTFTITNLDSTNSFAVDQPAAHNITDMTLNLIGRDYVVEPDVKINTIDTGTATFTSGSTTVIGQGTTWNSDLTSNDFIQFNHHQVFFKIASRVSDSTLILATPYNGDTTTGSYTAKRWKLGRTEIQYAKDDNIAYDGKKAMWTYDATKASGIHTGADFTALEYPVQTDSSGIMLKFTPSLSSNAPDIMDVAVVNKQTFSQKTQYDTFQFSLPKVPDPEDSMELYINNVKKTMFQDYILNYSQNPVYSPPPDRSARQVCNVMFLKGISNATLPTAVSESGQFQFVDSAGKAISEILAGSESIAIDGTNKTRYNDYMIDQNSGLVVVTDSTIREPIVKYVGVNYASSIDYGFTVYLNQPNQPPEKMQISFPAQTSDDILFQPATGRLKPRSSDHPGPDQTYEIHYMIEATPVSGESVPVITGQTLVNSTSYPIKQGSLLVFRDGDIATEDLDYTVSYLTGRITFVHSLDSSSAVTLNYTPLSKQINGLGYADDNWQCIVYDSRLTVRDAPSYTFSLLNVRLNPQDITILRIYNETRDADYDFVGASTVNGVIKLDTNSTNTSIGLGATDIVLIDYVFQNTGTTEFYPVRINYLSVVGGTNSFYVEGPNIAQYMPVGALVNLGVPNTATQYFFQVDASNYDGYGTEITTATPFPQDIVNPAMFITDASVSFKSLPDVTAASIVAGSMTLSFPANISNYFRPNTILKIHDDLYQVSSVSYTKPTTVVTVNSEILKDYTSVSDRARITYSDCPIYVEGATEVFPREAVVTLFNQPAFTLSNNNSNTIDVVADATSLRIDGSTFYYTNLPTLGDMSSAIDSSHIEAVAITTQVPGWQSDKIIPANLSIYKDSSSILYASPTLWYKDNTDSTNYSLSATGSVILTNPLQRYDRYSLDYMGQKFLGDSSVVFSTKFFVALPAKSKVVASFQYQNLDQFYIQVLSQRDFFENVSIPRMQNEAYQLSDNPGQGGTVSSDENSQPSDGGIANTIYKKRDAEIECRVFKDVYDFFSDRLQAFGDEIFYALGYKIFNNDGTFSDAQQAAATKIVNRIFPFPDYTNNEPVQINPIAGYFFDNGAVFGNGMTGVHSTGGTYWTKQFATDSTPAGFIGRASSTIRYPVHHVVSDSSLVLSTIFSEPSTLHAADGERYTAASPLPLYDDDGNMGAKIIGTRSNNFGLSAGDDFTCTVDGSMGGSSFQDLPFPFNLFFPISGLTTDQIANHLMSDIPGLRVTSETVLDPTQPFGYRTALVLRTIPPHNSLTLTNGSAISKLGFFVGEDSTGNLNPNLSNPEIFWNNQELALLNDQKSLIQTMKSFSNKLDRTTAADTTNGAYGIYLDSIQEVSVIANEINALNDETVALKTIINGSYISGSPALPAYASSVVALGDATVMLQKDASASATDQTLYSTWPGNWQWALDWFNVVQSSDTTAGQKAFDLVVAADNDRRILNWTIDGTAYNPMVKTISPLNTVDGTWTNTDTSTVLGIWNGGIYTFIGYPQSDNNKVTFTADTTFTGNALVYYQTISDKRLNDRSGYDTSRIADLTSRDTYLVNTRFPEVKTMLETEGILTTGDGQPGDLYTWANNRFNRRQGCEARLNQINQQIASNQSALKINKSFIS